LHHFEETKTVRKEYHGDLIVNQNSEEIVLQDFYPTIYRRLVTELPLLVLAIAMIGGLFTIVKFLTQYYQAKDQDVELELNIIGFFNGVFIQVFNEIYITIVTKVVNWENH